MQGSSNWRQRLFFPALALAIVAMVVIRRPASDPAWLTLALAAPGALPFVADLVSPRLGGSRWGFAAELAGALAANLALVAHLPAYAEFAPFLLVLVAARIGMDVPLGPSLALMVAVAGAPQALNAVAGAHVPLAVAVGTACSWLTGVGMRAQDRLLRELRAAQAGVAERAASGERQRITREIHDLVAHTLSVAMLHLTGARLSLADGDAAEAMGALDEAERTGRDAMREVRQAIDLNRPRSEPGTPSALPRAADLPELVARYVAAGLRVTLDMGGRLDALPDDSSLCLYRVAQESLANAARHAPGGAVRVQVRSDGGRARLAVYSDRPRPSSAPSGGLGIRGMAQRVAQLGGTFTAGPSGGGWLVEATVPAGAG
jgi:signal transduction histidine kinase